MKDENSTSQNKMTLAGFSQRGSHLFRQHGQYSICIMFVIIICDAKRLPHTTAESSGQCVKKLIMSIGNTLL